MSRDEVVGKCSATLREISKAWFDIQNYSIMCDLDFPTLQTSIEEYEDDLVCSYGLSVGGFEFKWFSLICDYSDEMIFGDITIREVGTNKEWLMEEVELDVDGFQTFVEAIGLFGLLYMSGDDGK